MTTPDSANRFFDEVQRLTNGNIGGEAFSYLAHGVSDQHMAQLAEAWHTIQEPAFSAPAFHATTLPPVGTTMRVSFQEINHVRHTLELYVRQLGSLPFKVLGYYNWPDGAPKREVSATRRVLHQFIKDHPEVPFAFFEGEAEQPMTAGKLSRLVTNALLPLIDRNGLILNHDADFVSLSKNHFSALHRSYFSGAGRPSAVVPGFYHTDIPSLPRINHLIKWIENQEASELCGHYFEPGPAVSVEDCAAVGSYDETVRLAENHDLIERIQRRHNPRRYWEWATEAHIIGSPRRFIWALANRAPIREIWTDDNFLAADAYRTLALPDLIRSVEDMPEAEYREQIRQLGSRYLATATYALAASGAYAADALAFERLEQIRAKIGGPDDMFAKAQI